MLFNVTIVYVPKKAYLEEESFDDIFKTPFRDCAATNYSLIVIYK